MIRVENGEIQLSQKPATGRKVETPGEAYARLVREAVDHRITLVSFTGSETDPTVEQARKGLSIVEAEITLFHSGAAALHDPLKTFNTIVDSRVQKRLSEAQKKSA